MKNFTLDFERETDVQKARYARKVDDEVFRLYVFLDRLPRATPQSLNLILGRPGEVPKKEIYTLGQLMENPYLKNEPIYDELTKMPGPEPVHSITFQADERNGKPTFGETYVPRNVLEQTFPEGDAVEKIAILAEW